MKNSEFIDEHVKNISEKINTGELNELQAIYILEYYNAVRISKICDVLNITIENFFKTEGSSTNEHPGAEDPRSCGTGNGARNGNDAPG